MFVGARISVSTACIFRQSRSRSLFNAKTRKFSTMESPKALIEQNKVMVFSKSYCPYCIKAKDALKKLGADFKAIELDKIPNGSAIQDELQNMSGQRSVPNIYVNGKHIGGCDDTLAAIASGELQKML